MNATELEAATIAMRVHLLQKSIKRQRVELLALTGSDEFITQRASQGGHARAKALSAKQRTAAARRAARARWAKHKEQKL